MDPKVISMYNIFGQRGVCVCKQTTSLCRTLLYHYPLFYKRNVCSQYLQTRFDDDFFYVKLYIEDRVLQYEYFKSINLMPITGHK
jgi:hypothetical protein